MQNCPFCLNFLRTKSSLLPADPRDGVRRLGPAAASHAKASLAKLNAELAAQGLPALRPDDPVFADRLHYQHSKTCYAVIQKELQARLPPAEPSAEEEPVGQPEPACLPSRAMQGARGMGPRLRLGRCRCASECVGEQCGLVHAWVGQIV